MEKNSQKLVNLASKRFSDIVSDGFKLFVQSYKRIILPLAIFQIILIMLDTFILTDLKWYIDSLGISTATILDNLVEGTTPTESEFNLLTTFFILTLLLLFFQNLIGAIIITIAMCTVSNYLYNKYMGIDENILISIKSAFNKRIFLPILIVGICIPLGSLLLFFPAIIIFGFFILLVFTYNSEDIEKPIPEARAIAKGGFWKVIGIFLFNAVIFFIIGLVYDFSIGTLLNPSSAWTAPSTRNYGMLILYQIIVNLIEIIFAPLFICLLTSLYATLKARKDLAYQYPRSYRIPRERYRPIISQPGIETTSPTVQAEGKFYCPFCGELIETPKKFCPNCGENVEMLS
ncbi:MAG: zinc ribbon domain-containing protein [Promethearchaeota archaeon]|jgi:hypothetical protein